MTIRLKNKSIFMGQHGKILWWEWTAFIEADDETELINIDYVEYRLHPSFKEPIVWIKKREGGFPLTREGWGTFLLRAKVLFKDKSKKSISLEHLIVLERPSTRYSSGYIT